MPSTRPGISFNKKGVCSACENYEKRTLVDWSKRYAELEEICNKYRGMNGNGYDCAIAVSGGKDSHYQVYLMKEVFKMNPILFSVEDNLPMTDAGKHNIRNISEAFNCNIISLKPDIKTQKNLMRHTFENYGKPTWFIDRLIYTFPMQMALKFNTPLLIYGENVSYEYGGYKAVDTCSAKEQLSNGVASDIDLIELLKIEGVAKESLELTNSPTLDELNKLNPIYISYYIPWNSLDNYEIAKKYGFKDLKEEWIRTHHIEDFDQIETPAYLVHSWLKYPKFGHAAATDYGARYIRYGLLRRDQAIDLIKKHDFNLDSRTIKEFCEFLNYTEEEFWIIINRFYNREIFKEEDGQWNLKSPIWEE